MCQNNLTQARVWLQNEIHATTSPSDESQYISHACTKYSIVSVLLPCTELTSPVHTTSQYRRFFTGRPAEFWECCCWNSASRDFLTCEVNPNLKWKPVVLTRLNHSKFSLSQISWSHSTCHPPNSFNVQESQSEGAAGWENIGFSCGRTSSWFRRVRQHRLPSSRMRSSQLADTHPADDELYVCEPNCSTGKLLEEAHGRRTRIEKDTACLWMVDTGRRVSLYMGSEESHGSNKEWIISKKLG